MEQMVQLRGGKGVRATAPEGRPDWAVGPEGGSEPPPVGAHPALGHGLSQ